MFLRRKHTADTSDEELVLRLCGGEREALGHLWDRYAHLLFGIGMKYLKDVERSKDTVVELFADLPGLLAKHHVDRFRPWVHTVMRNRCLLAFRSDRSTTQYDVERSEGEEDPTAGEAMLREATLERLEMAIAALNADQRACIQAFHLERLSYAQVAERTGQTIEQVRSHLQNGRRNLRLTLLRHADQKHT